jgi:hypothetical protein
VATSMVGKLGQKLYIYFQEPEGKFGTIVQKENSSDDPGFQFEKYFCRI